MADVDRDDMRGAALQQRIGEAAGGDADVERRAARDVDAEGVERGIELQPAARDEVGGGIVEIEPAVRLDVEAGLGDDAPVDADMPAQDRVARARPAGDEAALGDELIEPDAGQVLFFGGCHRRVMGPGARKWQAARRAFRPASRGARRCRAP